MVLTSEDSQSFVPCEAIRREPENLATTACKIWTIVLLQAYEIAKALLDSTTSADGAITIGVTPLVTANERKPSITRT